MTKAATQPQKETVLKTAPGSVAGSVYVTRGARILAEFFGHNAQRYAEAFIQAIEDEDIT